MPAEKRSGGRLSRSCGSGHAPRAAAAVARSPPHPSAWCIVGNRELAAEPALTLAGAVTTNPALAGTVREPALGSGSAGRSGGPQEPVYWLPIARHLKDENK